jgi:25S rRNA (adenine2142-N1)-methyltransferase
MSKFHTKLKQGEDLEELGGLEEYQRVSRSGEADFNSSDWVIEELNKRFQKAKIALLDVGAIVHRYKENDARLNSDLKLKATSIDLHSKDKQVIQTDFFNFIEKKHLLFDVVVLSLVLNFVPAPVERGKMLQKTAAKLKKGGLVLIVLPVSCISNSRYFKFKVLERLLRRVGLHIKDSRSTEKMFFAVCEKGEEVKGSADFETEAIYKRKLCRPGEKRNNFCILLPKELSEREQYLKIEQGEKGAKMTSNQRKRARMKSLKNSPDLTEDQKKELLKKKKKKTDKKTKKKQKIVSVAEPAEGSE